MSNIIPIDQVRVMAKSASASKLFSAKARFTHPSSGSFEYEYTVEDATDAGLIQKDNWRKNRKAMLRARCTSAGIRMSYPRCLNNMYLAEEVQDFEPVEIDEPKSEIIEGDIIPELDIKELKRTLTRRLKVNYNYNDAMIKEFADLFDISENVENLSKMVEDNEYLLKCIEQFEKENN